VSDDECTTASNADLRCHRQSGVAATWDGTLVTDNGSPFVPKDRRSESWLQSGSGQRASRIPLADLRGVDQPDLEALLVEVREDQALISGLKMGIGSLVVQRWDPAYAATDWTLHGADLTLDMGHPFGSMFYRNVKDGRMLRIGVKWHPPVQQLEFPALHPSKPELASDCTDDEVAAVVLDARSRIGTLVAVNAQIGSFVATEESENAILEASGLGLERLSEDDPRLAARG